MQTAIRILIFSLIILSSGCQQACQIEEGAEHIIYQARHPTTQRSL